MSYPRNAATPKAFSVGPLVKVADGSLLAVTTGVNVRYQLDSGSWGAGGGTIAVDATGSVFTYAPLQAETNGDVLNVVLYISGYVSACATMCMDPIGLPNAAPAASGGLPTVGTGSGQINPDGSGNVPATPRSLPPLTVVNAVGTLFTQPGYFFNVSPDANGRPQFVGFSGSLISYNTGTGTWNATDGTNVFVAANAGLNQLYGAYLNGSNAIYVVPSPCYPPNYVFGSFPSSAFTAAEPLSANVTEWLGTAVTAATAGKPDVSVWGFLGTALTGTAAYIVAAFKAFFNVTTPVTPTSAGYVPANLETWLGTTPNALNGGNVQVYAAPIATAVWQDLYTSSDCTTANSMGWIMGLLYTNVYSTITTISPSGQACLNVNVLGWGGSSALPAHFTSLMIDTYGYMKISGGTGTGQINLSAGNVPAIDPGGGNAGAAALTAYAAADGAGSTSRDAQLYAASEGLGGGSTNASDFTGSFSATVLENAPTGGTGNVAQQVAQETTKTGGTVWHVSPTGDDSTGNGLSWATAYLTATKPTLGAGDTLLLGSGSFAISAGITQATGGQIIGAGKSLTTLTSTSSTLVGGSGVCSVSDVTMNNASFGSPPISTASTTIVKRCAVYGAVDAIYGSGANGYIEDSEFYSGYDVVNLFGAQQWVFQRCKFIVDCTSADNSARGFAISGIADGAASPQAVLYDCDIAVNPGPGTAPLAGVYILSGIPTAGIVLVNCRISTQGGINSLSAGDGIITCYGCSFDRLHTSGTIIDLPLSALPVELAIGTQGTVQAPIAGTVGNIGTLAGLGTQAVAGSTSSSIKTYGLTYATANYVGQTIKFTSGALLNEIRTISSVTQSGSDYLLVVGTAFSTAPANHDTFEIGLLSSTNFCGPAAEVGDVITFTSGTQSGKSATVTAASNNDDSLNVIVVGTGLTGAPAFGDTCEVGAITETTFRANLPQSTPGYYDGQTLTMTSGTYNTQSATVTGYTYDDILDIGTVELGAGLSGAPSPGDTFTVGLLSPTGFVGNLPSTVNSYYVGRTLVFTLGLLAQQEATVTAYNGVSGLVTIGSGLGGSPSAGDQFVVVTSQSNVGGSITPAEVATAIFQDTTNTDFTTPGSFGSMITGIGGTVSFNAAALASAPGGGGGGGGSPVPPIVGTASNQPEPVHLPFALQYGEYNCSILIEDENGNPVTLTGRTLEMVFFSSMIPSVEIFSLTTESGLAVDGTTTNQLDISIPPANTQSSLVLTWNLWDTTSGQPVPLLTGTLPIGSNPAP